MRSLAFSPDGSTYASGAEDGKVILWDAAGNKEIAGLRRRPPIPCGRLLTVQMARHWCPPVLQTPSASGMSRRASCYDLSRAMAPSSRLPSVQMERLSHLEARKSKQWSSFGTSKPGRCAESFDTTAFRLLSPLVRTARRSRQLRERRSGFGIWQLSSKSASRSKSMKTTKPRGIQPRRQNARFGQRRQDGNPLGHRHPATPRRSAFNWGRSWLAFSPDGNTLAAAGLGYDAFGMSASSTGNAGPREIAARDLTPEEWETYFRG